MLGTLRVVRDVDLPVLRVVALDFDAEYVVDGRRLVSCAEGKPLGEVLELDAMGKHVGLLRVLREDLLELA